MSYRNEHSEPDYESMGLPSEKGQTVFCILSKPVPPIAEPEPPRRRSRTKAEQTLVSLMNPEERAERRRQQFLERKGITSFNTAIATSKESDRTNSIRGKL